MQCSNKLTYPLLQSLKGKNGLIDIIIKLGGERTEKWIRDFVIPSYVVTHKSLTVARGLLTS